MFEKKHSFVFLVAATIALGLFASTGYADDDDDDRDKRKKKPDPFEMFNKCAEALPPTGKTLAGPAYLGSLYGRVWTAKQPEVNGNRPAVCMTVLNASYDSYACQGTSVGDVNSCAKNNDDIDPKDARTYCYDTFPNNGIYLGCEFEDCKVCWRIDEWEQL